MVAGKLRAGLAATELLDDRVVSTLPEATEAGCRLLAAVRGGVHRCGVELWCVVVSGLLIPSFYAICVLCSGDLALYKDGFPKQLVKVLHGTQRPRTAEYISRFVEHHAATDKGLEYLSSTAIVPTLRKVGASTCSCLLFFPASPQRFRALQVLSLDAFESDSETMEAVVGALSSMAANNYTLVVAATTEGTKGLLKLLTRPGMTATAREHASNLLLRAGSMVDVRLQLLKARPTDYVLTALKQCQGAYVRRSHVENLLKLLSLFSKVAARRLADMPDVWEMLETYVSRESTDVTPSMYGAAKVRSSHVAWRSVRCAASV